MRAFRFVASIFFPKKPCKVLSLLPGNLGSQTCFKFFKGPWKTADQKSRLKLPAKDVPQPKSCLLCARFCTKKRLNPRNQFENCSPAAFQVCCPKHTRSKIHMVSFAARKNEHRTSYQTWFIRHSCNSLKLLLRKISSRRFTPNLCKKLLSTQKPTTDLETFQGWKLLPRRGHCTLPPKNPAFNLHFCTKTLDPTSCPQKSYQTLPPNVILHPKATHTRKQHPESVLQSSSRKQRISVMWQLLAETKPPKHVFLKDAPSNLHSCLQKLMFKEKLQLDPCKDIKLQRVLLVGSSATIRKFNSTLIPGHRDGVFTTYAMWILRKKKRGFHTTSQVGKSSALFDTHAEVQ